MQVARALLKEAGPFKEKGLNGSDRENLPTYALPFEIDLERANANPTIAETPIAISF
jgi:hypothetical protein